MTDLRITVAEVRKFIKGIAEAPGKNIKIVRFYVKENVG